MTALPGCEIMDQFHERRDPYARLTWEVGAMRLVYSSRGNAGYRRGSRRPLRVLLALVLMGWIGLADGSSAGAHTVAGSARQVTAADVGAIVTVQASTTASFNQSSDLTHEGGGTNDATVNVDINAMVDETYEEVPANSENGGVKLLSWKPSLTVTGDLDSTCTPSPDRQKPSPCDIGYYGPGYQNFTCSAAAVELSQFPSQLTDPLHADFPLFAGFQVDPYQAVAIVGGAACPTRTSSSGTAAPTAPGRTTTKTVGSSSTKARSERRRSVAADLTSRSRRPAPARKATRPARTARLCLSLTMGSTTAAPRPTTGRCRSASPPAAAAAAAAGAR